MFTSSSRAHDEALLHFHQSDPLDWIDAQAFGRGLAAGTLRREWTWLALLDGRAVARGVWWGPVGAVHPVALRCLIVERSVPHPEVWGAALIRSAHRAFAEAGALLAPDVELRMSRARRDDPAVRRAVAWRREAAAAAGLPVESVREVDAPVGGAGGGSDREHAPAFAPRLDASSGAEPGAAASVVAAGGAGAAVEAGVGDATVLVSFSARVVGRPSLAVAGAR